MDFDTKIILGILATLMISGGAILKEMNPHELDHIVQTLEQTGKTALQTLSPYAKEIQKITQPE